MNFSCDLPHFYKNSNSNIRDSVCVFQSQRQFVPSKIVILNRGVCVCVCVCVSHPIMFNSLQPHGL